MSTITATADPAERRFVKYAMEAPMLEVEHERALARRWHEHQDEKALHELTGAHIRLVFSIAKRFRHYGLAMSDLAQEGNVGLMMAGARFDPAREVRFSTYAAWWVRSAMQDYVLRNWSIVRTGTTSAQKSLFFNLRRLRAKIDDTDEGMMSAENREWVAEHLGLKVRDVERMAARLSGGDRSLNAPVSEESGGYVEWQDLLADPSDPFDEQIICDHDNQRRADWIASAMKALTEREANIIRIRRLGEETVTLESLGAKLGISKERVRQIEHQALGKLRRALLRMVGDPEKAGLVPDA